MLSNANLLPWIVAFPLVSALACGVLSFDRSPGARRFAAVSANVAIALAWLFNLLLCLGRFSARSSVDAWTYTLGEWFHLSVGQSAIPINATLVYDGLASVMVSIVTTVGLLIHLYSARYMHHDAGRTRFFAYLNLFMAAMLLLVLANNLPLMFIGWEGVGFCSYLLIGFWWHKPVFADAGRKAFIVNRIGDACLILGMFLLISHAYSLEFAAINKVTLTMPVSLGGWQFSDVATLAALLIFIGCIGKSAQWPLHVWLPDAMAGPTPVSALIHAATMVTAGIYLACRMQPIFVQSSLAMQTVLVVGVATALLGAWSACWQHRLKKILAFSTISQLGFMMAAIGYGAFDAALFHVFTHAFFKAALFLVAGTLMMAVHQHDDVDIRKLGGLRQRMPRLHWVCLIACLALAGVPGTSGFFSKDLILAHAMQAGASSTLATLCLIALLVASLLTAFYAFRVYFTVFHARHASYDSAYDAHPADPLHRRVQWPLWLLALGAIAAGWIHGEALHLPWNLWNPWLGMAASPLSSSLAPALAGSAAAIFGIVLAWLVRRPGLWHAHASLAQRLSALSLDALYRHLVHRPLRSLAAFMAAIDEAFFDFLTVRIPVYGVTLFGWMVARGQRGFLYAGTFMIVLGTVLVMGWMAYPHIDVEQTHRQNRVSYRLKQGVGYSYRWDYNGDGRYDTPWKSSLDSSSHTYTGDDFRALGLKFADSLVREGDLLVLNEGDRKTVPIDLLGAHWQRQGSDAIPPAVHHTSEGLLQFTPNAAQVKVVKRRSPARSALQFSPGDTLDVGGVRADVLAQVEAVVQVRNALGYMSKERIRTWINPDPWTLVPRELRTSLLAP